MHGNIFIDYRERFQQSMFEFVVIIVFVYGLAALEARRWFKDDLIEFVFLHIPGIQKLWAKSQFGSVDTIAATQNLYWKLSSSSQLISTFVYVAASVLTRHYAFNKRIRHCTYVNLFARKNASLDPPVSADPVRPGEVIWRIA